MKQPVLEHRLISDLRFHAPGDHHSINEPDK
jgi:hypothetical protein